MRVWKIVAAAAALISVPTLAHGHYLTVRVHSGETKIVWRYANWTKDCTPEGGVISVKTKPEHGKLTKNPGPVMLTRPRFQEMVHCLGQTREGMIVSYTSDPGFRGHDSFVLEVKYPGHPTDVDTFTIMVQ